LKYGTTIETFGGAALRRGGRATLVLASSS
jgi:hypothetical protein